MISASIAITQGGVLAECQAADPVQYPTAARRANSYRCPVGRATGRGYVLLRRRDLEQLNGSAPVELTMTVVEEGTRRPQIVSKTFRRLWIDRAEKVSKGGHPDDGAGVYLVHLVDIRHFLNRWASSNRQINVRSWAGGDPHRDWLTDTVQVNGNILRPRTCEEIIGMLWSDCRIIGPSPRVSISAPPWENLHLAGVNPWHKLHDLLESVGQTTFYDPLLHRFTIGLLRDCQTVANEIGNHEYESRPVSGGATLMPEHISVVFPMVREDYGTERDTEANNNVVTNSHTTITKSQRGGEFFRGAHHTIWDHHTVAVIQSGTTDTLLNFEALDERAEQLVDGWKRVHAADACSRGHQIVMGLHREIRPGPAVRLVVWRDFGFGDGSVTESLTFPGMPDDLTVESMQVRDPAPKFNRDGYPNFPRLPNQVQVYFGRPLPGENPAVIPAGLIYPITGNVFGGQVRRYNPVTKAVSRIERCWVINDLGDGEPLRANKSYAGRLNGMITLEDIRLPLYVVSVDKVDVDAVCDPEGGDEKTSWKHIERLRARKSDGLTFREPWLRSNPDDPFQPSGFLDDGRNDPLLSFVAPPKKSDEKGAWLFGHNGQVHDSENERTGAPGQARWQSTLKTRSGAILGNASRGFCQLTLSKDAREDSTEEETKTYLWGFFPTKIKQNWICPYNDAEPGNVLLADHEKDGNIQLKWADGCLHYHDCYTIYSIDSILVYDPGWSGGSYLPVTLTTYGYSVASCSMPCDYDPQSSDDKVAEFTSIYEEGPFDSCDDGYQLATVPELGDPY